MLAKIVTQIKISLLLLIFFTFLTGIIYPFIVTVLAQLLFPWQANGSLIESNGEPIGSILIGQAFTSPNYFLGRPSATLPFPYNAESSAGSNFAPSNPHFLTLVQSRVNLLRQIDPANKNLIPVDLVTASASGLDPDISPLAAFYQVSRIAKIRHLPERDVAMLVLGVMEKRPLKLLGESRVNVLMLNLELDHIQANKEVYGKTS